MSQRPPQRPNPRPALQRPAMLGAVGHVATPAPAAEAKGSVGTDDLMQQFNAALQDLQDDPSLDQDTREALRQQFSQMVSDMGSIEGAAAGIPDRAMWMDAVQALQASGEISENEVNDLIRQINQALQPLQRRESQLAIEFSRRLSTEGEERALAWFRKASAETPETQAHGQAVPKPSRKATNPLRSDVVNSRSRRLRGPP